MEKVFRFILAAIAIGTVALLAHQGLEAISVAKERRLSPLASPTVVTE